MALAKAALDAQQARERWQQESQAALLKAEQAWMAHEAARLAAAEAKWREQSASALAEATARCEAGEAMLAQLKEAAAQERSTPAGERLWEARVDRESGFEQAEREQRAQEIVIRPHRIGEGTAAPRRAAKKLPVRDVFVAASLAVLAVAAYSSYSNIGPFVPQGLRTDIERAREGIVRGVASMPGRASAVVATPAPPPVPAKSVAPPPPAPRMALVVRDVNLRDNPSNESTVISTLARGVKVATIEKRGNWTLVQVDANSKSAKTQLGWVYGSFLKEDAAQK
jgi:hypothetical protein